MTGILEMFSAFSEPDEFEQHVQLELFAWAWAREQREYWRVRKQRQRGGCVQVHRCSQSATRYLWNSWAEAEGEGQPRGWVFGPDLEMRNYLVEMEESFHEAPAEIQAVIREAIGR